ncbi:MAG TPA: glycosyltransferase family A protein [Jatrophihabitans sp.]|nr:glycosyltransferase family A protein [Jatrophihabitans sp.]
MTFAAPDPVDAVEPGSRPSFSVIVAAWQAADVIGAALRSALDQSEPPLEIIVCDDGSTDDLDAALAPFGAAVRLLRVSHGGAAAASNVAAAAARGDFVAVLDADDTWHPRRLERLGDLAAARPDLDLLTTDAWFVVDGTRRGRFYESNVFAVDDQATEILRRTFFFAHVAIRRTRWVEAGGFAADLARGYDWDLQLRLLLSGSRAGCVLEPLADYTIHGSSLSADRYESMMARVELLDRASATQQLTAAQRAVLAGARTTYRRRALAARAEHALVAGAPGRRRACARLALAPGAGLRTRARAAAGAIAPGRAGRRLRRDAADRGRARSDRVLT